MARGYWRNVAIGVDQLANTMTGGWPDETLSSRCGRLGHRYPYKFWKVTIDWVWEHIFRAGPNHCVKAYEKEKTRYHFPPEMRTPSDNNQ